MWRILNIEIDFTEVKSWSYKWPLSQKEHQWSIPCYSTLTSFTDYLIQCNYRGLRTNFNSLHFLIQSICLQETYHKHTDTFDLRHDNCHHSFSIPGRGPTILVRQNVHLNTFLQAVAIRLTLHIAYTLCSLYIQLSSAIRQSDLQDLYDQFPKPFTIMGDLYKWT